MKRGKQGLGYGIVMVLAFFLWGAGQIYAGAGTAIEPNSAEKLTFFAADPFQYGLWAYDPMTNQRELVNEEITEHYQLSPNGRYLAFLANNLDRGRNLANTVSLWVKDLSAGTEMAIMSDFDTDNNLDGKFTWLQTGELLLEQLTHSGKRQISVVTPAGEIIWTSPEDYQYLCHKDTWVVLQNQREQTLYAYNLLSHQWQLLPTQDVILKASLSPDGAYLSYQTAKEIVLLNLQTGEKGYIDGGDLVGVEFGWSPYDRYLVYQSRKVGSEGEYYQLTALQVEKKIKELEVTSPEPIEYSWTWDAKQMAYSIYRSGWNIMVWMPEQSNTVSVQTGLKDRTVPLYRAKTHEFVYLDRIDGSPAIFSYQVDLNHLRLLQVGPTGGSWANLHWTPLEPRQKEGSMALKFAGMGEIAQMTYLRAFQLEKGVSSDADLAKAAYGVMKWAPNHRTLLYQNSEHGMTLFDAKGESLTVTFDSKVGELFWNPDGALIGGLSLGERNEFVAYSVFQQEVVRYPLPAGKPGMVQWMDQRVWMVEDRLMRYYPMSGEWDFDKGWKEYWWPLPRVEHAHYLSDSVWQIGANCWLHTQDGRFRVLTRLSESILTDWREEANEYPRFAPDDQRILYHKRLVKRTNGKVETKWQIWLTTRSGAGHQYLCDGGYPQWLGNYQFLFLRSGDLWLANLVTGQLVQLSTPKLQELAFMVSYDNALLAVVARDREEKVGLYLYEVK